MCIYIKIKQQELGNGKRLVYAKLRGGNVSATSPARLRVEIELYETRKSEWLKSHRDEFVVVKSKDILGFFADFHEAYSAGVEKYGTGTDFLVKRVVPHEPLFEVF